MFEHRSGSIREITAHGLQRGHQVGEQDGRIHSEQVDGHEGDLSRQFGSVEEMVDRAMFLTQRTIRCENATCLTHQPDRGKIRYLSRASLEEDAFAFGCQSHRRATF